MKQRGSTVDLWDAIRLKLHEKGVDLDQVLSGVHQIKKGVKVVCVAPDLRTSVEEMSRSSRDQVVMVRVDEKSNNDLDAWVETGAVSSKSEAAALFIREGLKVRAGELEQLQEGLQEVQRAKERLRKKTEEVLGKVGLEDAASAGTGKTD